MTHLISSPFLLFSSLYPFLCFISLYLFFLKFILSVQWVEEEMFVRVCVHTYECVCKACRFLSWSDLTAASPSTHFSSTTIRTAKCWGSTLLHWSCMISCWCNSGHEGWEKLLCCFIYLFIFSDLTDIWCAFSFTKKKDYKNQVELFPWTGSEDFYLAEKSYYWFIGGIFSLLSIWTKIPALEPHTLGSPYS